MVKIGPPCPKVDTLDVNPQRTYADTSNETWQIIKFFLEELKLVNAADLEPKDLKCGICTQDFTTGYRRSHRAVRLPCKHIFGEPCIKRWLSPYRPCVSRMPTARGLLKKPVGANTCPNCRRVFFPKQKTVDVLPEIEIRINVWDMAYRHVGVALSETERRARADLLLYLTTYFDRGSDEHYPPFTHRLDYLTWAHKRLLIFSNRLKQHENLTPVQKHLRQGLEKFARHGFRGELKLHQTDLGGVYYQVDYKLETVQHSESNESGNEIEIVEENSDDLADGDTEEMKFFRAMFRSKS